MLSLSLRWILGMLSFSHHRWDTEPPPLLPPSVAALLRSVAMSRSILLCRHGAAAAAAAPHPRTPVGSRARPLSLRPLTPHASPHLRRMAAVTTAASATPMPAGYTQDPVPDGFTLELTQPDDWHVHLRDLAQLRAVTPLTAAVFGRALVMPNLRPPVTTTSQALAYRGRVLDALPCSAEAFQPLMSLYLTDKTPPEEVERAKASGRIVAFKVCMERVCVWGVYPLYFGALGRPCRRAAYLLSPLRIPRHAFTPPPPSSPPP